MFLSSPSSAVGKLFHLVVWVSLVWALVGCDGNKNPIDISNTPLPSGVTFLNWNDVLDACSAQPGWQGCLDELNQADSMFWRIWCEDILLLGEAQDSMSVAMIPQFMQAMKPMLEAIDSTSGEEQFLSQTEANMALAMRRLKVMLPELELPRVVWMPTGFNFGVYPAESLLAVGLEWFIGDQHPLLQTLPPSKFPAYRIQRMRPEWMASDALRGWLAVELQSTIGEERRTADMLLFWGKILHVLSRAMPEASPAQLMNWSEEQWQWAMRHERSIWQELQPQDVMFSNSPREVMRWFQEGPFTRAGAIPQESPDRLGMFIGWRMVESHLTPETTTQELMLDTNPLPYLQSYRP